MSTIVCTIAAGASQFVIEEIRTDLRGRHLYYSEAAALDLASAQHRPVTLVRLDGTRERPAVAFDPDAFERHAYLGYVCHGLSMTDGHFVPEPFEQWVSAFRRHPDWRGIDAPWPVVDALGTYKAHRAAAPAA
ncbi:hypothetical protein ACIA8R_29550 [Nonomuraea sp. NPDC051191]|uniref:hypothetical protein n=1 Tax=Nonomuraea sp. NPDC051191 TaxID=3364372 RepID=UPI0037A6A28B